MADEFEALPIYYRGRKWDAPLTDDALLMNDEFAELVLAQEMRNHCNLCEEIMLADEDLMIMPYMVGHTECIIRSGMGDVPHLEGRCSCAGGDGEHDDRPYRETAKATVQWLIDNKKGRFHD